MRRHNLVVPGPGRVELVEEDLPRVPEGGLLLRTEATGLSAGTELTAYRGSNPYLTKKWDEGLRLFVDGSTSFEYPVNGWGYEEVGEIVEVGADAADVAVGDADAPAGKFAPDRLQDGAARQHEVGPLGTDARIGDALLVAHGNQPLDHRG